MSAPQPPSDRASKSTQLVYGLEARVPLGPALLVSFQHVSAMVVGTITPALILAGILKFSPADTAYLVSMALLASAVGTFFQTGRYGLVGSGLLSVTGTSFAFLHRRRGELCNRWPRRENLVKVNETREYIFPSTRIHRLGHNLI